MKTILSKLTFGKPKRIVKMSAWIFFEDLFSMFPAIGIYIAINILSSAFSKPYELDIKTLWTSSFALIVVMFLQYLVGLNAYLKTFMTPARYTAEDRVEFIKKLRRLPLGFFGKKQSGELINTFVGDFLSLQQAMTGYMSGLFSVAVSCVLTSVFMFIFNPVMAAAMYASIPVTLIILVLALKTVTKNSREISLTKDKAATNLNEYLSGMKTLKSYNQTGEGFSKLKIAYHELMSAYIRAESGSGSAMRLCASIVRLGLPLMCMAGAYLIIGGRLSIVDYISIIVIGTKILSPMISAVGNVIMLRGEFISAERLHKTMSECEMTGKKSISASGDIRFEHVCFSYGKGEKELVLDDITFTIPKDKLTAIVGPSGSGKTTILRLIARFWDAENGKILCKDEDISQTNTEDWQKNISMVLQDVYLFHETIRENILFGRKDATEEEMIEAAKKAQCHDFIMELPDRYDTVVGEGGSTLSGGEKQRISIARAILKKSPILLLDEPTASLDAKNEVLIQKAIGELVKNCTVIMIAHRLKTVRNADQIIVLDGGKIAETGTHDDLISQNGIYSKLWEMQSRSLDWSIQQSN